MDNSDVVPTPDKSAVAVPEKEEDNLLEPVSFIQQLPEELRVKIFSYFLPKETLNLRLVCRQWDREIQDLHDFGPFELDEGTRGFENQLELRIRDLRLVNLEARSLMSPDGSSIFAHPNLITRLSINAYKNTYPRRGLQVSPSNVLALLELLHDNLRTLKINLKGLLHNHQFPPDLFYVFPNLTKLFLESEALEGLRTFEISEGPSLLRVLENSVFPKLQHFKANMKGIYDRRFSVTGSDEVGQSVMGNLLRLVGKNGKLLKSFQFEIGDSQPFLELEKEDLDRLMAINQLQTFQGNLNFNVLGPDGFWRTFLANQKNLTELTVNNFTIREGIPHFPYLGSNNWATLVRLRLVDLGPLPVPPRFDLSVFEECKSLKHFFWRRFHVFYSEYRRDLFDGPEEVFNFHRLPDTLTYLGFRRIRILSSELSLAFDDRSLENNTKGFKNLEKLILDATGMQGGVGITPDLLEKLLSSRNLLKLEVSTYKLGSDNRNFQAVFTKLGLLVEEVSPYDMFKIKREEPGKPWECKEASGVYRPVKPAQSISVHLEID